MQKSILQPHESSSVQKKTKYSRNEGLRYVYYKRWPCSTYIKNKLNDVLWSALDLK